MQWTPLEKKKQPREMICFELKRNGKKRKSLAFTALDTIYDTSTLRQGNMSFRKQEEGGEYLENHRANRKEKVPIFRVSEPRRRTVIRLGNEFKI